MQVDGLNAKRQRENLSEKRAGQHLRHDSRKAAHQPHNGGDDNSGLARRPASGRQINLGRNRDNSRSFRPQLHDHIEQWQFDDAGRKGMFQQEVTQRAVVVRVRRCRMPMRRSVRLGSRFRVMMVMMLAASVMMLHRLRVSRAIRVAVVRVLVGVNNGRRGGNQQRTRRQPSHHASSPSVKHDSSPSKNLPPT